MLLHTMEQHLVVHRKVEDRIVKLRGKAGRLAIERNDELGDREDGGMNRETVGTARVRAEHRGQMNGNHAVSASVASSSRRQVSIGTPSSVRLEIS